MLGNAAPRSVAPRRAAGKSANNNYRAFAASLGNSPSDLKSSTFLSTYRHTHAHTCGALSAFSPAKRGGQAYSINGFRPLLMGTQLPKRFANCAHYNVAPPISRRLARQWKLHFGIFNWSATEKRRHPRARAPGGIYASSRAPRRLVNFFIRFNGRVTRSPLIQIRRRYLSKRRITASIRKNLVV